jgi:hypothetical protein
VATRTASRSSRKPRSRPLTGRALLHLMWHDTWDLSVGAVPTASRIGGVTHSRRRSASIEVSCGQCTVPSAAGASHALSASTDDASSTPQLTSACCSPRSCAYRQSRANLRHVLTGRCYRGTQGCCVRQQRSAIAGLVRWVAAVLPTRPVILTPQPPPKFTDTGPSDPDSPSSPLTAGLQVAKSPIDIS